MSTVPLWHLNVLPSDLSSCPVIGSKATPDVAEVLSQSVATNLRQHHTSSIAEDPHAVENASLCQCIMTCCMHDVNSVILLATG